MKTIHTVTTVRNRGEHPRCVAWFEKRADALDVVEKNRGDIYEEGYYPYAIIEELQEGLYAIDPDDYRQWFQWDYSSKKYVPCDTPEWAERTIGWGIG
jgi:hypothetical protein